MSPVRRVAALCLALTGVLATGFVSRASAGTEPMERAPKGFIQNKMPLDETARGRLASAPTVRDGVLAYAPAAAKMPVLYLHGMHGRAENGCPWFRSGASEIGWLVCPQGIEHEASGASSWGTDIEAQSKLVARALRTTGSSEPGVAIGFSQGGYVTLDLVKSHQARFRGLVLIAAPEAHPSADKLHDAGVKRVALAAGSRDAAYAPLVADTKRLVSEGMDARFFDLGRVGHTYAAEDPAVLEEAIAWAAGKE